MHLKKYERKDEESLISLLKKEGWDCYTSTNTIEKYKKALLESITYVAYEENTLCGYSRSLDDYGFYIYICDLLVDRDYRNNKIGQKLMEQLCIDYPEHDIYVMSDEDKFYLKKGYIREGSIFKLNR
ncbi:GNAT family N-acetyltransferase [Methanobrevibacter sp. TMH8]|uniref:GNAT family N-acetyltransferase n=1 Tax=Methanobrevibacter sp. TMH8 TaxID=2848611 RepID=UPI001CCCA504|nr:GNAT family N-acetyltransferase [Methanobrevibacter sp. TMH8]MBZ9571232.1 GNAT family N-acetyltransferase [Methanobrevibacter sp. TMH8]